MRNTLHIVFIILLCFPANAQELDEFAHMPKAYEIPQWDMENVETGVRTGEPWWVFADRDGVQLYADQDLTEELGKAEYLEAFAVWQESENALRLVSCSDPNGELFYGQVFGELAVDRGWVRKEHLILWPQALQKNDVLMKALISSSLTSSIADPDKPTKSIVVPENEFRIYNVIKKEGSSILLMGTKLMHRQLQRESAFWVESSDVFLLDNRASYVPRWEEFSAEDPIQVYKSYKGARDEIRDELLVSLEEANPFLGFLEASMDEEGVVRAKLPSNQGVQKAYINNKDLSCQKAYLLDYNQFLQFKGLLRLFTNYELLSPEDLELALSDFFMEYGIGPDEFGSLSVAEMLEKSAGFSFNKKRAGKPTRVGVIGNTKRRRLMVEYSDILAKLDSYKDLAPLSFSSELEYFWIPEEWILPGELFELALIETSVPEFVPQPYKQFEVFYVDGSSVETMDGAAFELMFEDFQSRITNSSEMASLDAESGLYTYYSNGTYTIKNDRRIPIESTVDDILANFRKGSFFPDKNGDKATIENELYTKHIESIQESLVMNFYIPQSYFSEDLWERGFMLMDLPERIYSLTMPKKEAQAEVNINLYNITDEKQLERDIDYINERFSGDGHLKFNIKKYQ